MKARAPYVAPPPKVIASIGAGVQSSTCPLMCGAGVLPYKIDAGIFADTQAEPAAVYRWLDWLEKQLPFPIYRVTRGNLAKDGLERRTSKKGITYWKNTIPFFVATPRPRLVKCASCRGKGGWSSTLFDAPTPPNERVKCVACDGTGKKPTGDTVISKGKMKRKCTAEYKIREIVKRSRAIVGAGEIRRWARHYGVKRERVTYSDGKKGWRWIKPEGTPVLARALIGISLDEIQRMKPSREPWIENVYPLVDAGLTRQDCLRWMRERGFPEPPRSACYFCPYHNDDEWARMKREDPESFAAAAQFEAAAAAAACEITRGVPFLHSSLRPLPLVNFDGTGVGDFGNECEGMCGS